MSLLAECQVVEPKIHFGTEEWYPRGAPLSRRGQASRAGDVHLQLRWLEAKLAAPWVTQNMAMKKLVWSETAADGPAKFPGRLPEPPSNEGPVRDSGASARADAPHFYRDSAVIAYRTPQDAAPARTLHPRVTASSGAIDAAPLMDDSLNTSVTIPASKDGSPAWLQFEFAQPYTARALLAGRSRTHSGRQDTCQRRRHQLPCSSRHARPAGLSRRRHPHLRLSRNNSAFLPHRARRCRPRSGCGHSRWPCAPCDRVRPDRGHPSSPTRA